MIGFGAAWRSGACEWFLLPTITIYVYEYQEGFWTLQFHWLKIELTMHHESDDE